MYQNRLHTTEELAEKMGVKRQTILVRITKGWALDMICRDKMNSDRRSSGDMYTGIDLREKAKYIEIGRMQRLLNACWK